MDVDADTAALEEAIGIAIAQALDQRLDEASADRDRELEGLRREIKLLRDEIGLERGLAKFKAEVAQARQQARNRRPKSYLYR
jgi:hypothetical protein